MRSIKGSCDSQPDTTAALAFTFSLNLSSLFMEGHSGGIVFGVLSSYVEIMSIVPNQSMILFGLFNGLHNHSDS